jgi:MBG domain (YGX type)/Bacterial Ig-like domain (group 3)/Right handed beta helix region
MWTPFRNRHRKSRKPARRTSVPRIEVLEGRLALATFTVSTTDDGDLTAPSDNTLRGAIMLANRDTDPLSTINFSVNGTIALFNALPVITHPVTIDGVGHSITLDGTHAGARTGPLDPGVHGLVINADDCTVRNLTVTRFSGSGIFIINGSGNHVENNHVTYNGSFRSRSDQGITAVGILELPGGTADGNFVTNNIIDGNLFGLGIGNGAGSNSISGNTISNSTWDGVQLFSNADESMSSSTTGNFFSGNTITGNHGNGIAIAGSTDPPPVPGVIDLGVVFNTIQGNTIASNDENGVLIDGFHASSNSVFGNSIHNNIGSGVRISGDADGNLIGGVLAGQPNTIDSNGGDGVMVQNLGYDFFPGYPAYQANGPAQSNSIRGNSIYGNTGLAIDLNNDGITFNDANDSDSGPNGLQNYPVLSEAVITAGVTAITGTLNTTPSGGVYRIDFYAAPANANQTYLGQTLVTADPGGQTRFTVTFPVVPVGQIVVATATDSAGNTSEFSPAVAVTSFTPSSANPANGASGSIAVAPPSTGTLVGLDAVTSPAPSSNPPPAGVNFPVGFIEFAVIGLVPGATSTVTLTLDVPAGQTVSEYWKYGPEVSNPSPHWYKFMFDGTTGAVIGQNSATQFVVTLRLVDGLRGDYDLAANGIIVDPGAPGVTTNTQTTITSSVSSAVYGDAITYYATVSALDPEAGAPAGSVQFYADGAPLGSAVPLTDGLASISAATLTVGIHNVTVAYTSDGPAFLSSVPLAPVTETITPAPLTITANDAVRAEGAANPPFTASYAGFVLGEGDSVLVGNLIFSTPADASSPPGDFPITVGGVSAANYDLSFLEGTLTVAPVQTVDIDAHPTSLNLASNGIITVALFTTLSFDALRVDVSSVLFAGAHVVHSAMEDVDGDGDLDRILQFRTQDTNLRALYAELLAEADQTRDGKLDSNVSTRQTPTLALTGQTVDGVFFEGFDALDLFLSGKSLRGLLDELASARVI